MVLVMNFGEVNMNIEEQFYALILGGIFCGLFTLCIYVAQIRDFLYKRFNNGKNN